MLFKVNMIILPIMFSALLTWGIWVTSSIYGLKGFVDYDPRFTQKDGVALERSILKHVEEEYVRKKN